MSYPLIAFSRGCCGKVDFDNNTFTNSVKILAGSWVLDALVSITSLIVGILGATSVIAMPAAAAYALIGVSGAITLLWISLVIAVKRGFDPSAKPKQI